MKRIVALLLAALLLTGCTGQTPSPSVTTDPAETTLPVETTVPQQTTVPVDPGSYMEGSSVETQTDGAVRAFDPGVSDCASIFTMGEDLLLVSGSQIPTLTVLTGENLAVAAQKELNAQATLAGASVQVNEQGIAYHDASDEVVIFLDTALQETKRLYIPEGRIGSVSIAPDHSAVYFCMTDGVYALDVATGITRTLREQSGNFQTINNVLFNGTVLDWYIQSEGDALGQTAYLSAQTGETVRSEQRVFRLLTAGDRYIACVGTGSANAWLTAGKAQEPRELKLPLDVFVLDEFSGERIVFKEMEASVQRLNCLNVITGKVEGTVSLSSELSVTDIALDAERVWMVVYDFVSQRDYIYEWDPAKSPSSDNTNYLQPYYTEERPDVAGLNRVKIQAQLLGQQYGVDILIWDDVLSCAPWDYTMVSEHQVSAYQRDLEKLEGMLAAFPEGFMEAIASGTSNGRMTICLVRSLLGDPMQGSLESANGIQYWLDESAYIALAMGETIEQTFYHELSHVMENRIISTTYAYDFWDDLNPADFEYDGDYNKNAVREDYHYLGTTEGQERAFIDMYSMSFAKEDRARIFEYAMMPGNEDYFNSEIMQNKLRTISLGIREAFELESETPYIWEQYLKEPIIFEE